MFFSCFHRNHCTFVSVITISLSNSMVPIYFFRFSEDLFQKYIGIFFVELVIVYCICFFKNKCIIKCYIVIQNYTLKNM